MSSRTGEFELKQWLRENGIVNSADVIGVVSLLKRLGLNLKYTSLTLLEDTDLTSKYLRSEHIKISDEGLMKLIELRNQLQSKQNDSAAVSDAASDSEEEGYVLDEEKTTGQFKQNPYIVKIPRPSQPPPRPARARRSQRNDQSRG
jgi:hypothetical protein